MSKTHLTTNGTGHDSTEVSMSDTDTTPFTIPQLADKAVLVQVIRRQPAKSRKDRNATAELAISKGADESFLRVWKKLFSDADMRPITSIMLDAYNYFRENTLPWFDQGWRILPLTKMMEFEAEMERLQHCLDDASSELAEQWDEVIARSQRGLQGMFDPSDYYRDGADLKAKIHIEVNFIPVPTGQDFRSDALSSGERTRLAERLNQRVQEQLEEAIAEPRQRLFAAVTEFAETLKDDDAVRNMKRARIKNLGELVQSLRSLNISGDPELDKAADAVTDMLDAIDFKGVKIDPAQREKVTKTADSITDAMAAFYGKKVARQ
jgi:hypothetical protein